MEVANELLRTLKEEDITEIKNMSKPQELIRKTCESVALFLGVKPVEVPDPNHKS